MKILHDVRFMELSFDTLCPYCGRGDGEGGHAALCKVPEPVLRVEVSPTHGPPRAKNAAKSDNK